MDARKASGRSDIGGCNRRSTGDRCGSNVATVLKRFEVGRKALSLFINLTPSRFDSAQLVYKQLIGVALVLA